MSTPLITVVIPTFQRRVDLEQAVMSLCQPGCEEISLVISDNASDDGTEDFVNQLDLPFALDYRRNPENLGICRNFYQASRAAIGTFQFWLTDDDYVMPGMLAKLVESVRERSSCGYMFSHVSLFPPETRREGKSKSYLGPSADSFEIQPGIDAVAKYARYGWVYSRQLLRTEWIDWKFWEANANNAYIPILISGRMMLNYPSFYDANCIVSHAIENECHWEEFGSSAFKIKSRIMGDFRMTVPSILSDCHEDLQCRRVCRDWRLGSDERFLRQSSDMLSRMSIREAYRALRQDYRATRTEARSLLRKCHQPVRERLRRKHSKRLIARTVGVRSLPV